METAFPILDPQLAERVYREGLLNYLADNQNAWQMEADGHYQRCTPNPGQAPFSAQLSLLEDLYV